MSITQDSTSISAVANRFEDELYDLPKAQEKQKSGALDQFVDKVRESFEPGPSRDEQRMENTMHLRG